MAYTNRNWTSYEQDDKAIHELKFTPFYDEEILVRLSQDQEDPNIFDILYSDELTDDFISADSIEEAKNIIEEMIIEHYKDQISYYNTLLTQFTETTDQED